MWLAGGGVKPGLRYGATDDYGYYAVENKVHIHDLHATILHLLGLDHERLTYSWSRIEMRSLIFFIPILSVAAIVPADISGVRPGPITVSASAETLTVRWPDEVIPYVDRRILVELREAAHHEDRSGDDRSRPQRLPAILGHDRETPRPRRVRRVLRFSWQSSRGNQAVRGRVPAGQRQGPERREPDRSAVPRPETGHFRGRDRLHILSRQPANLSGGRGLNPGAQYRLPL